jgi:integrase
MERNPNPLTVSKKISKADKFIPKAYLLKIYEIVDHPLDDAYISFHAEVGVRVSDIVGQKRKTSNHRDIGLEVNNIDWQNNKANIYDHKKNKWRYVTFPEKVKAKLKRYMLWRQSQKIEDRQLFPISEKTCNRIIKKWCKKVEFPYSEQVASHWLRHTFIRLSRSAGRDIKFVQANTGDTVNTILEWYSDLNDEDKKREIETKPIT